MVISLQVIVGTNLDVNNRPPGLAMLHFRTDMQDWGEFRNQCTTRISPQEYGQINKINPRDYIIQIKRNKAYQKRAHISWDIV